MKTRTQAIFLVIVIAFSGCGDDQVENPTTGPIVVDPTGPDPAGTEPNSESSGLPQIALEELDQAQDERLEQMFEELKDCDIERLSEIDANPS